MASKQTHNTSSTTTEPTRPTVGHPEDLKPDYPTAQEFVVAGKHLVDYLRGEGEHSCDCLCKAGWICLGFASSYMHVEGRRLMTAANTNTPSEKLAVLESALNAVGENAGGVRGDGFLAFNWKDLITIVLDLIRQFIAR